MALERSAAPENSAEAALSISDLPPALLSEILRRLDPVSLALASCVSALFNALAAENHCWRQFYLDRWGAPPASPARSWKDLFAEREKTRRAFMGRFTLDLLRGHTETVRSVFLLASAGLVFTGGYDSVVRAWDADTGLAVATSRPLGCTIRAIAADTGLLVAAGTDAFLQCWEAVRGHPFLFKITGHPVPDSEFRLWGHEGPVTCLALDPVRIYSGSWDMSVRVWDRAARRCLRTLQHSDWVWSLSPRGATVASTAGRDVYVWDIDSGALAEVIGNAHAGHAVALARSCSGELLFTGGEDGTIHMYAIGSRDGGESVKPVAIWMPHSGAVNSLSFEFPWLVSCSNDGRLALIDVRKLLKSDGKSVIMKYYHGRGCSGIDAVEPPQRMLDGAGCNLFSVDISADRIVCGGEEGSVRVWNFSQALEIEKRVQAARRVRMEGRLRRRMKQIEMNSKGQCSVAAKGNQVNGDRGGVWRSKQGLEGKVRA